MKHKKKVVLLMLYRGSQEVDAILPLIYKLSKEFTIFTYFKSQKTFNSLKSNTNLFKLWKKVSKNYYVESKLDNFFWKVLRKISSFFLNENNSIVNFLNFKIHGYDFLKKKIYNNINTESFKIDILFSESGVNSGWVASLKKNKDRPFIVHYMPSPFIQWKSKLNKEYRAKWKLSGDILLLSSKEESYRWRNYIQNSRIKICGILKYDKWWLKKNIYKSTIDFNYKNLIKNNFLITIAYSSYFDLYPLKKETLEKQLQDIMNCVLSFPNIIIVFKVHPAINSNHFLKILEKYDKKRWIISKSHIINLSAISSCLITHNITSTQLDAIVQKIPSIELWPVAPLDHNYSAYTDLGLSIRAKNEKNLKKLIKMATLNNQNSIWKKQQSNFKKIYSQDNRSNERALKVINEGYNKLCNSNFKIF